MLHGTAEDRIPAPAHRPRHRKPDQLAILPVGDVAGRSYEELYVEHAPAARRVALSMVPRDVADDIVAEAFTRVLGAIRAGGGPGVAFRAYLLAAVRNTANDWLRASRRTTAVGDVEEDLEERVPEENLGLARLSRGPEAEAEARAEARLVAQAFTKLPARWRAVLWQLEVEAKAPAAIAPMFGLSANGVSALAVRAREGLRQAYLAEHVGANIPAACRSYAEALSADTRGRLSRRRQAAVHDHLAQCTSCHSLAGELTELNSRLGAILTPVALAGAMSAGGQELLHLGGAKAGAATGAKAASGVKAGLGGKLGAGAKAAATGQWRAWKLHPLTSLAAATAVTAAAGGMVVVVSVSPLSPFHTRQVSERPAASSAHAFVSALSSSGPAGRPQSLAGTPVAGASATVGGLTPTGAATGAAGPATGVPGVTGATGGLASTSGGMNSAATPDAGGVTPGPSRGSAGSLVQGVGGGVGSVVQNVGRGAGSAVTGAGQGVDALTQAVGVTLGTTTSGLGAAVGQVTGSPAVGGTVSGTGGAAAGAVKGAGGAVGGVTGAAGGAVSGTTGAAGGVVSGATKGAGGLLGGKKP
ncbi:MAG TPA: sigma-70 family RNA polymerase sigma factor [Streptosporangiaceae bacterium]